MKDIMQVSKRRREADPWSIDRTLLCDSYECTKSERKVGYNAKTRRSFGLNSGTLIIRKKYRDHITILKNRE